MKKLFFVFFLISNSLIAQIVFENTLSSAFEKAKKENKSVFIEFYNETCHHCQKVQPILTSKEVGDVYNPKFISYKINTYNGLTPEEELFLEKHKLFFTDVPNFIYFDQDENFLHHASGRPSAEYIINLSKDAFNPKIQTSKLSSRVKNGDKSLGTLYQYSLLAQLNQNKTQADSIANVMYEVFDKSNLGNETSYIILKNAVFTTKNDFFKYWTTNQRKLKNMDSGDLKGNEVDILKNIISIDLTDSNFVWNKESLNEMYNYMLSTKYTNKPENILVTKRVEFFNKKDPSKDLHSYYNSILKNEAYGLDDKIYILGELNSLLNDKKSKKTIQKYADDLDKIATAENNEEALISIKKIKKNS